MIWEKPRVRQIGSRWRCQGHGQMKFGATMDDAYRFWARAAGLPPKGAWA